MKEWKKGTKVDVISFSDFILHIEPDSAEVVKVDECIGGTEIIINDELIGSFLATCKGTNPDKAYYHLRGSLSSSFRLYGIDLTEMIKSLKLDVRVQRFAMEMSVNSKEGQLLKILGIKENLLNKSVEEEPTSLPRIKYIYRIDTIFYQLRCHKVSSFTDSIIFTEDKLQLFVSNQDIYSGIVINNSLVYYLGFTERNKRILLTRLDAMFELIFDESEECEKKKFIYTELLKQIEVFENDTKKEVGRS